MARVVSKNTTTDVCIATDGTTGSFEGSGRLFDDTGPNVGMVVLGKLLDLGDARAEVPRKLTISSNLAGISSVDDVIGKDQEELRPSMNLSRSKRSPFKLIARSKCSAKRGKTCTTGPFAFASLKN